MDQLVGGRQGYEFIALVCLKCDCTGNHLVQCEVELTATCAWIMNSERLTTGKEGSEA